MKGYEIHMGRTFVCDESAKRHYRPVIEVLQENKCDFRAGETNPTTNSKPTEEEEEEGMQFINNAACKVRESLELGMQTLDGRIWGTYLHGLFDSAEFLSTFLRSLRPDCFGSRHHDDNKLKEEEEEEMKQHDDDNNNNNCVSPSSYESIADFRERQYEMLTAHFADNVDVQKILEWTGLGGGSSGGGAKEVKGPKEEK